MLTCFSDAILDAHLKQDPNAKVACECVVKTGMVLLCGEINSSAVVDYQKVVRDTINHIGYVQIHLHSQLIIVSEQSCISLHYIISLYDFLFLLD